MINYDKPTPQQQAQIAAVLQRRLAELQQLPQWTDHQFEEVLFCLVDWSTAHGEWVFQTEALCALAFDVRVPQAMATKLASLVKHWKENGQPDQYRSFKPATLF